MGAGNDAAPSPAPAIAVVGEGGPPKVPIGRSNKTPPKIPKPGGGGGPPKVPTRSEESPELAAPAPAPALAAPAAGAGAGAGAQYVVLRKSIIRETFEMDSPKVRSSLDLLQHTT